MSSIPIKNEPKQDRTSAWLSAQKAARDAQLIGKTLTIETASGFSGIHIQKDGSVLYGIDRDGDKMLEAQISASSDWQLDSASDIRTNPQKNQRHETNSLEAGELYERSYGFVEGYITTGAIPEEEIKALDALARRIIDGSPTATTTGTTSIRR